MRIIDNLEKILFQTRAYFILRKVRKDPEYKNIEKPEDLDSQIFEKLRTIEDERRQGISVSRSI